MCVCVGSYSTKGFCAHLHITGITRLFASVKFIEMTLAFRINMDFLNEPSMLVGSFQIDD